MDKSVLNRAQEMLNGGLGQAEELLKNPGGVAELLKEVEKKIKDMPLVGETVGDIPTLISIVKSYITGEYKNVSPKVIILIVAAFIYAVKKKDLISDNIPVIGIADDLAVIGLAISQCGPEIDAYRAWKKN